MASDSQMLLLAQNAEQSTQRTLLSFLLALFQGQSLSAILDLVQPPL